MKITAISDLHGRLPDLPGGDLLIVAGDLTAWDTQQEYNNFFIWFKEQKYLKKILVAGNHDNLLKGYLPSDKAEILGLRKDYDFDYLCDSGTEFQGLKIWGSPWSLWFHGINPKCEAFTGTEHRIRPYFRRIPQDTDILVTHSPPWGIFDAIETPIGSEYVGSMSLRKIVLNHSRMPRLKLHVFGHIHEHGGRRIDTNLTIFANVSYVNERLNRCNDIIEIELPN